MIAGVSTEDLAEIRRQIKQALRADSSTVHVEYGPYTAKVTERGRTFVLHKWVDNTAVKLGTESVW